MNKRNTLLIFIITCLPLAVFAQSKEQAKANAKAAAAKMGNALVNKDYKTFVSSTYPKAVEMSEGGLPELAKDLERQIANMEAQNNTIVSVTPGNPSAIIDTAGEWQCTIPQSMMMKIPNGRVVTETTLIALSPDKGKTWYFMDAADRDVATMRGMFPNISSKLVLPKSPDPVFKQ